MRAIKKNMKDHILHGDRRILWCPLCGDEYSGDAGDYWDHPDDHIFYCSNPGCGGTELRLVKKVVRTEYVE